jgi:hypothetical protein
VLVRPPSRTAARARKARARRRQGLAIFYIEANEAGVVEARPSGSQSPRESKRHDHEL